MDEQIAGMLVSYQSVALNEQERVLIMNYSGFCQVVSKNCDVAHNLEEELDNMRNPLYGPFILSFTSKGIMKMPVRFLHQF